MIQPSFLSPRNMFLIDGIGATLTAILLSVVLTSVQQYIGLPVSVLFVLSAITVLYALYSFSCYWLVTSNWKPYLKTIIIANGLYACSTIALLLYYFQQVTAIGLIYFALEFLVMLVLIIFETKVLSHISKSSF